MVSLLDKFKKKSPTDPKLQSAGKVLAKSQELSVAELEAIKSKTAVMEKTVAVKAKKEDTREAYRVIIKPLVTEKGTWFNSQSKYLFKVSAKANKVDVQKAVYHLYNVWPTKVNMVNLSGKAVTYGRVRGRTSDWKKAVVTVPKGVTLSVYEGV